MSAFSLIPIQSKNRKETNSILSYRNISYPVNIITYLLLSYISYHVIPYNIILILSYSIIPYHIICYIIRSYPIMFYHIFYLILPYVISQPTSSHSILSYPMTSNLVLSYTIELHPIIANFFLINRRDLQHLYDAKYYRQLFPAAFH